MIDAPLDSWYAWLGLAMVSLAVLGVVLSLPRGQPPEAARVADAIDGVAASEYDAVTWIPLDADAIRLDSMRLALRSAGGVSHATFAFGPVTPADDGPLRALLRGQRPRAIFETREAFESTLERTRTGAGAWRTAPDHLFARRVSWGNVSATIVG